MEFVAVTARIAYMMTMHPPTFQYTCAVGVMSAVLATFAPAAQSATSPEAPTTAPKLLKGPVADLEAIQKAFEKLARVAAPSVVTVKCAREPRAKSLTGLNAPPSRRRTYGAGSGVIIRSDGMILTNEHVIHGSEDITVHTHDGKEYQAAIVQTDPRSDLAVIQVSTKNLKAAALGDVSTLRQGHLVFAMGNPFGVASDVGHASMSWGLVSALGRPLPLLGYAEQRYYGNLIETTAAINPGNSGGPLFDIYGRVVGITTAISTRTGRSEGVGFAVPISRRTRHIIAELLRGHEVEYGLLGVLVHTPEPIERKAARVPPERGALVDAVDPGSPGEAAGIKPGDMIIRFDGQEILDSDHLVRLVGSTSPGQDVEITLHRRGAPITVEATVTRLPRRGASSLDPVRWRGLTVVPLDPQIAERLNLDLDTIAKPHGLVISYVRPQSSAYSVGLRAGMVLRRLGEETIATPSGLREAVRRVRGKPARLTIYGGRQYTVQPD